jgi:hypothetical protein
VSPIVRPRRFDRPPPPSHEPPAYSVVHARRSSKEHALCKAPPGIGGWTTKRTLVSCGKCLERIPDRLRNRPIQHPLEWPLNTAPPFSTLSPVNPMKSWYLSDRPTGRAVTASSVSPVVAFLRTNVVRLVSPSFPGLGGRCSTSWYRARPRLPRRLGRCPQHIEQDRTQTDTRDRH